MLSLLKNHPFAVAAHFTSSLVLTFAVPKAHLQQLIPECLELDMFNDQWGFVAVAMVETKHLRPKGFPRFLGNDFFLIGYRIFVRYTAKSGKKLRGLYIIKSETDKKKMEWLGNIFTRYSYTTTDIKITTNDGSKAIKSQQSNFEVIIKVDSKNPALPVASPFKDWKEARKFSGPLPFTFSYDSIKKEVLIVEGVRQNWTPMPVTVCKYHFGFLELPPFKNAPLANAFIIQNIPYYWKKGRIEKWQA